MASSENELHKIPYGEFILVISMSKTQLSERKKMIHDLKEEFNNVKSFPLFSQIAVEKNDKSIARKTLDLTNSGRLDNTVFINEWILEIIKKEIKTLLKPTKNNNTPSRIYGTQVKTV